VYSTEELVRDHRGFTVLLDPPPMLWPPELLPDEEYGEE